MSTHSGGKLDTLGESGTQKGMKFRPKALVSGKGTDILNNPSLAKRAKRKVITQKMVLALIDVAKEKGDTERQKAYWNAYHCQSNLIVSDNKSYGDYCKNRYCTICNAIKKADFINRYYPIFSQWEDIHFVTLTAKSCKGESLNMRVWRMFRYFDLIHNRCKKRHQRGKGIKLVGVKTFECNFNPIKKTYNPHFHIIVPSREIADLLKKEWLKQWRPIPKETYRYKYTSPKAQDIRKVNDLDLCIIEVMKYSSKIFTDPEMKKKKRGEKSNIPPMIYAYALDNILVAMSGKRISERFGFNLPPQEEKKSSVRLIDNYENWIFPIDSSDWINENTGECLTGYKQTNELSYLLNERINKDLH